MSDDATPYRRFDARRGHIVSRAGGWRRGEGVYARGFSMMDELVGQASYMQVQVLNITGRLPDRRLADWLEAIGICMSWPDPRIWCNQVGALAGTARASVVAGTCGGILAADSRTYGSRPVIEGMNFIQNARRAQLAGQSVATIVETACAAHGGKPLIMGYARPVAKGDERVTAMEPVTARLGFVAGPHLELAYAIEAILLARFDESMNINGYVSAFLSDQGFSPEEGYRLFATVVMSGVTACYVDAAARPAGEFLPLRCEDIEYQGPAPRALPAKA